VALRLAEMGCDLGQGWLFGRPMPAQDATAWLRDRHMTGPKATYDLHPEVTTA